MNRPTIPTSWRHRLVLLLICIAAFSLRFDGINWPAFHPDEATIGRWVHIAADGRAIKEKFYANGFFVLVKPAIWISKYKNAITNHLAYRRGLHENIRQSGLDTVMVARWFNVWAGTLGCLLTFLLIRCITGSPWSGVFGAALIGLAQYHVEHCHYAETDLAMLLALTAALWLMAVAADRRQIWRYVLAAGMAGFATGTKFTLSMLLPLIILLGLTLDARPLSLKKCWYVFGLLVCGLIGFAAGFLLAMPQALDWGWFTAGLAYEKARVFGETRTNFGPLRDNTQLRYLLHLRQLFAGLQTLGWGWLVLAAAGVPCAILLRVYRRFWLITIFFPACFGLYWIFMAPWVRSQEFMAFLPALAALAALAPLALWRAGGWVWRSILLMLLLAAITQSGINSLRVASLFFWKDTRVLARQWLDKHLPPSRVMAVENYAEPAWSDPGQPPVYIYKVERDGFDYLVEKQADYLLRAAGITGRGLRHPLTDSLYDEPRARFDEFLKRSELLRAWASLPPQGMATFVSPAIELYGLKIAPYEHSISLELPQPLFLSNYLNEQNGRQTFCAVGRKLGAATGLLLDRNPRTIAVGGPQAPEGPVYLVLNTAERAAVIVARGFGQTQRVALNAYDTAIVPLERPAWRPRPNQFEQITLRAEPVKSVVYLPCFARLAFSSEEAARMCLDLGARRAAAGFVSEKDLLQADDPAQAYLLAVEGERWNLAEALESRAAAAADQLALICRAEPAAVRINGNSGFYYDEFARLRLSGKPTVHIETRELEDGRTIMFEKMVTDCLDLSVHASHARDEHPLCEAAMNLPVRLARGVYTFQANVLAHAAPSSATLSNLVFELVIEHGAQRAAQFLTACPGVWTNCALEFNVRCEIQPRLLVRAAMPARLLLRATEIRWSLRGMAGAFREELVLARVRHHAHRADYASALQLLADLPATAHGARDLELRQLELECRLGLQDNDLARAAANRLLELAPDDYQSLCALARFHPPLKLTAEALADNLNKPFVFGDLARLATFRWCSDTRKVFCVWETLRNETPPLAITFWIRRRGEWRKKQTQPLGGDCCSSRGERKAMEIKLDDLFAGYSADTIALGLESAVQWHPGPVPATGERFDVMPFADLLRAAFDQANNQQ